MNKKKCKHNWNFVGKEIINVVSFPQHEKIKYKFLCSECGEMKEIEK